MEIYRSGSSRMRVSAAQVKAVQEGGKRADLIRDAANTHHAEIDVPNAELLLDSALQNAENKNIIPKQEKKESSLEFWEQAKMFWKDVKNRFSS